MTRANATSGPRILIADDQADVLKALRLLLRPEGYEITTASSVQEIVDAAESSDFDVVLMDLNYVRGETSGKQGLDLLKRIRQLDESLPLVVMTAWSSIELAVEAMRRGCPGFRPEALEERAPAVGAANAGRAGPGLAPEQEAVAGDRLSQR